MSEDLATRPVGGPVETRKARAVVAFWAGWDRHPADAARLIVALLVAVGAILLASLAAGTVEGFAQDVIDLVDRIPAPARRAVLGLVQLFALLAALAIGAVLIVGRRWALLLTLGSAAVVAALTTSLLGTWVGDSIPPETIQRSTQDSFVAGAAFPSLSYLAAMSAVLTTGAPTLSRGWRRLAWATATVLIASRVVTATATPVHAIIAVAIGSAVGSAALLVFGAPIRKARLSDLGGTLAVAGQPVDALVPVDLGAANGSTFRALGPDGPTFVKVVGRDERDQEWLFRALRAVRVKGLEDRLPTRSAADAVTYEAVALTLAERAGGRVPRVLAVGETRDGWAYLAIDEVDGRRLEDLDPAEVSDELLDDLWRQVACLQQRRIAHRWLNTHHVLVSDDGTVHLLDFRWSVRGADAPTLGADLGELLTSTTLLVGADRAVAAAARACPADQLALALPYLQARALTADTQRRLKQHPELLDELRAALQAAAGVEHYEMAELQRITVWGVLMLFGTGVMIAFVLAVAANLGDIVDAFGDAAWSWLIVIVILTALAYPAGALSLMGAVAERLPFVLTSEIMLAQSFLNRFTPANVGGMALRVRYVQGHGVDITNAAASVGITSGASGVMQLVMLVVFFVWAGQSDQLSFSIPKVDAVAVILLGVGIGAAVVWLTPWGRRVVQPWLHTNAAKVWVQVRAVGTNPSKVVMLFGGAGLSKLVTILAFWASMRAFGYDEPIAQVAVLYMVATTVASAVPTPGGVGAIEAALIAGLTGIDVPSAEAFSIVIVFRLITYWLPVPVGYLAYGHVQRIKAV